MRGVGLMNNIIIDDAILIVMSQTLTLIFCHVGHNRSAFFLSAYLLGPLPFLSRCMTGTPCAFVRVTVSASVRIRCPIRR